MFINSKKHKEKHLNRQTIGLISGGNAGELLEEIKSRKERLSKLVFGFQVLKYTV